MWRREEKRGRSNEAKIWRHIGRRCAARRNGVAKKQALKMAKWLMAALNVAKKLSNVVGEMKNEVMNHLIYRHEIEKWHRGENIMRVKTAARRRRGNILRWRNENAQPGGSGVSAAYHKTEESRIIIAAISNGGNENLLA